MLEMRLASQREGRHVERLGEGGTGRRFKQEDQEVCEGRVSEGQKAG